MNHAGDAAEQVVRMSLEGAEVALKITGVAAKNLAAALYTILKDQKKTKGKGKFMRAISSQKRMNGLRTKPLPKKSRNCLPIRSTDM